MTYESKYELVTPILTPSDKTLLVSGCLSADMKLEIERGEYQTLSFLKGRWDDLSILVDLPIKNMRIKAYERAFDWKSVLQMKSLKSLEVRVTDCKSMDFSALDGLTWLDYRGEVPIVTPKSLKMLSLTNYKENLQDVFSQIDGLEYLKIMYSKSSVCLEGIENHQGLRWLKLDTLPKLLTIEPIIALKNLESLEIVTCKKLDDFTPLRDLTKLTHCWVAGGGETESFSFLGKLTELEYFGFSAGSIVRDNDIKPIFDLHSLKICEIDNKRTYNLNAKEIRQYLIEKNGKEYKPEEVYWEKPEWGCLE